MDRNWPCRSLGSAVALVLVLTADQTLGQPNEPPSESEQNLVLERVVVTARKRSELIQDVPVSVNVTSGTELQRQAIGRIEQLYPYVPNLFMTETAIGSNLFVRGIGSGVNQGFEQSVGIYVDGVYLGRPQLSRLPFFDLERIEVLRGPQSTLFGKNSIAGALNLTTRRPTTSHSAELVARYEPVFDERELQGTLSGPLGARSRGRVVARTLESEGFVSNLLLARDEPRRSEHALRFVFDSEPSEALSVSVKAETASFDIVGRQIEIVQDRPAQAGPFAGLSYGEILVGAFQQPASALETRQDYRRAANGDFSDNDADNVAVSLAWDHGDFRLDFLTGFAAYDYRERCDCDITVADVFSAVLSEDFEQISQEVRLTSTSGERFDYIVGAYFHDNRIDFEDAFEVTDTSILVPLVDSNPNLPMPPFPPMSGSLLLADTSAPRTFRQDAQVTALFGQLTWKVRDRLRLNLGGRYTREQKQATRELDYARLGGGAIDPQIYPLVAALYNVLFNATPHSISGDRRKDKFMPSLQLEWDSTDSMLTYFSIARGFKSGGFDARSNNPPVNSSFPGSVGTFSFEDEEALSVEIGSKMILNRGRGEFYGALYETRYDNMQVSTFDGTLGFNVGNAGEAVVQGAEFEGSYRLTEYLSVSGGLALTDFEFRDYIGQCYFGRIPDAPDATNCDYSGQTNQFVSDFNGTLALAGTVPLGRSRQLSWKVDAVFTDDYLLSPTLHPDAVQKAYTKFGARIAVSNLSGSWEVSLIGRNLTNESTSSYGNETPLAASLFGAPGFFGFIDRPRSVAVQTILRFQ